MTNSNQSNKKPLKYTAGTLMWYWGPNKSEQERVMLLEDLSEQQVESFLGTISVLCGTMKKTVFCNYLSKKKLSAKPKSVVINPCGEIPLEIIDISQIWTGNTITVQSTGKIDNYPDSIILNETTIK